MVIDFRARDGETPVRAASKDESSVEESSEPVPDATPSAEDFASPTPEPTKTKSEKKKDKPVRLIIEGVTIQVLNGTSDPEAGQAMATELTELGFQVVTVESTSKPYKETTVYWSIPDAERAGDALASKRNWLVDEKPDNLSDSVSLHVVVGDDFL